MRATASRLIGRLPPIARRDAEIARLRTETAGQARENAARTAAARRRAETPTFSALLTQRRAYLERATTAGLADTEPLLQTTRKLRNIALAESHDIPTAPVHAAWPRVDAIDLEPLPGEFVLKADGGTSGRAVLPLRRTLRGYERIDTGATLTADDVRAELAALGDRARGPFFAEGLLCPTGGDRLPDDVKVYAFYGVAVQVLLIRPGARGRKDATRRYLDARGEPLGKVLPGSRYDSGIAAPGRLGEIVAAAEHLSRAVGSPFVRIDMYDTADGIRFGEITRAPGGTQTYRLEHDAAMGAAWLDAQARLAVDVRDGRPHGTLWGHHPYDWPYTGTTQAVTRWGRPSVRCDEWCGV